MSDIEKILKEVKNFVAIESHVIGFPHMWGFEHPDEDCALFVIDWLKEKVDNRQAILNIFPSEKTGLFNIQLINVGNIEILNKKQVSISKSSKSAIRNYSVCRFAEQVFLMPFGDLKSIHYYTRDIEVIPNKIILQ